MVAAINRRAMDWCIANDLTEAAVAYGHAAGETDTVAGLVDALALPLYYDGRMQTAEEWLGWFSDDELMRYPALAVFGAWFRALTGRPAEAERWLALADGATSTLPLSDGSATIEPWVAALRAHMMPNGVEQALADAELALNRFSAESMWRPTTHLIRGVAHALLGATDRATDDLTTAVETGQAAGAVEEVYAAQAMLALLAARQGAWRDAGRQARAAARARRGGGPRRLRAERTRVRRDGASRHPRGTTRGGARCLGTRPPSPATARPRPALGHRPGRARAHTRASERSPTPAQPARSSQRPSRSSSSVQRMGSMVEDARELHERVEASTGSAGAWAMSLTGAELRLLPYLATHLLFPEIASRLFISRNTVKTESVSIYRKLGVSSRSAAIERAVEVGLLESSIYPPRADFTLAG